uniref:Contactin associated protein 2 n=1 Tax=Esox lucius TaxID=8010 RepID=A0A6Q2WQP0_ESOLU
MLPGPELTLLLWIFSCISSLSVASSASRKCDEALATPLSHAAFTSSSVYSGGYGAGYAKLNRRGGAGGWSPVDADRYQWLQVDLGTRKQVTSIATQGRYSSSDWTTQYRLLYSDTGRNWRPYLQDGNIWAFSGNSNSESVVRHDLQHAVIARYVRIIPLEWSQEGRIGLRVEIYGCSYWSDVISFDGQGVISYRFKMKKMKILKDVISLKFRTTASDGVLIHGEGQQGDYISLELKRSKLLLMINLGSNQYGSILGHTSVTSGSLLDDDHWHAVIIERYRRNVNFTLDRHTQHFRTNGEFDHLDLDYEISFGGMPVSAKPSSGGRENFVGCMEGITYNGDNITNLVKRKKVDTSSFRNLTFSCSETQSFPVFFNATSFLHLPGLQDSDTLSVSLSFRTWNPSGLLLYTALADGVVEVGLTEGKVTCCLVVTPGSGLNDGQWHSVYLHALENYAMLTIDGDEASTVRTVIPIQIRTGGQYYFGGTYRDGLLQSYFLRTNTPPAQRSFQGCMQLIHVDDQLADLPAVEKGNTGTFENVSLDMCAIIDRCVPNHCEHGGRCSQTWDTFSCSCNGTGYTGSTCHTSVYEQSCEEYKHLGKTSGTYWIDPDGSGPVSPFKVNCNMTEDMVWTTVRNNLSPQTPVSGSDLEGKAVLKLNYNMSTEQVIFSAQYCEQHVAYACRMSRLLNTPEGSPFTWWVGRANERHHYWGGSGPGIQKCACGIERNCTDPKYYCNCDADQTREDSGLLVYKDHLPVTQVVVGDTGRSGSEAKLTVGPLRCQGDGQFGNYWNAASFNTPASYLHFPTFQGDTSADISFYFKTSSSYGVFLENLGNADFIRLELKAAAVVSFSFDVGNGLVELTVRSSTPLNDDQWHRVVAERNVKEAVLQLDGQYKEVRPAPPQGHTRLELYSQLYVGASGGQRGFLGCIRALKMNGVTLDLEERATVTPGVKPGCSGHCTSYGQHCRNGGKCMEKYNGYSCDCTLTAYDGPFCTEDVGGFFESGTLVRYDFLPEGGLPAMANVKSLSPLLPMEGNLTQEELVFSFSTSNAPSILVYISSRTQDYLAVVDGQLLSNSELLLCVFFFFFNARVCYLFFLSETGQIDPVLIEKYNTPGFVGCLSRVQFNNVAPLKAALRSGIVAPVTTHGILVESNCGASPLTISPMAAVRRSSSQPIYCAGPLMFLKDLFLMMSFVLAGIIAVVIFTILCTLVFLVRHMFRHKGSYHTNEAKGAESADCADAAIIVNDPAFTETIDESKKEWFI